ncbi:RagB/SusD family nutrient uptake outer membrane protein [Gaetbulibacter saemankumensis]|uniref:RagB/SusD family nutrient uptake outer membrane protein n=1 Tax=Gaetbulibacter saemankumensis TaxID=311208 RepID=UPI00146EFDE1|nr:RagB/SusD family nutrient uptake outer membrane protein [Gaetbulibacter saemankumensis]
MKKHITHIIIALFSISIVSCDAYLDVQPEDKILEEDIYKNEDRIRTALVGIYGNITSQNSYASQLTMSLTDVLAQRYDCSESEHEWGLMSTYNYNDESVQDKFDALWKNMYQNILNINNFIKGIDTYSDFLNEDRKALYKGEAIGLRAMLHFDLLRIFGPVYSQNPNDLAIPYYIAPSANLNPISTASEVIDIVLSDLQTAETFLDKDPVREYGKVDYFEEDAPELEPGDPGFGFEESNFFRFRNLRLNYFAVKALQARVHLYAGNNSQALENAKAVINEATKWFPWTTEEEIGNQDNPNLIFSKEVLFGLEHFNIRAVARNLFSADSEKTKRLVPNRTRLEETFEGNEADPRFGRLWIQPASEPNIRVLNKFSNVSANLLFMQPLIRMSEMYYIVAETEPDPSIATDYLNIVREKRALGALDYNSIDLDNEIMKEYRKEFYGEGQLFFYYKRRYLTEIPNGTLSSETIPMSTSTYVVPLPLSETDFR